MTLNIIDLFCGAGGFSLGFKQVFPDANIIGFDSWDVACKTYEKNIGKAFCEDLTGFPFGGLKADILIGSPPCQEWSIGKNGRFTCEMDYIQEFSRAYWKMTPKFWVWECAPMTSKLDSYPILNAADFGVPQNRRRAFHSNFSLPQGIDYFVENPISVERALGWKEHRCLYHNRTVNRHVKAPFYPSYHPARTIVTWPPRIYMGHDRKGIELSVDEVKVLMGFPESFEVVGSKSKRYKQLGNAVCPPVARAIAERIKEVLSRSARSGRTLSERSIKV